MLTGFALNESGPGDALGTTSQSTAIPLEVRQEHCDQGDHHISLFYFIILFCVRVSVCYCLPTYLLCRLSVWSAGSPRSRSNVHFYIFYAETEKFLR